MQNLVARVLGLRRLAAAQLFADLLDRGGHVRRVHVGGQRAHDVFLRAEGLDLKTERSKQLAVALDELAVRAVGADRDGGEQGLRHDAAVLRLEPVEDHALVRGVLVDQQQLVIHLDDDIGLHRLPHYLVVGQARLFNILNSFFHNPCARGGLKACHGNGFRLGRRRTGGRKVEPRLPGRVGGAQSGGLPGAGGGLRVRGGRPGALGIFRRALCAALVRRGGIAVRAELLGAHGLVEILLRPDVGGQLGGGGLGALLARQGAEHGVVHRVEHLALLAEFDLGLGGVDVDVHAAVGEREIQHAAGVAAGQQRVAIGLLQRGLQQLRADRAPVAEEILRAAVAASGRGGGDIARHAHAVVVAGAFEHVGRDRAPEQGIDARILAPVAGGEKLLLAVADKAEGDLGVRQRAAQRRRLTGGGLGPVGFHEFLARGGVVEKLAYLHRRALGAAEGLHLRDLAGLEQDERALGRAALTRDKTDLRHGGDGGKRLAAEAHRRDSLKPALVVQLARRVAQKGDARVLRRHAAAVVRHTDHGRAAAADLDGDVLRPGVQRVFAQLLDHGSRALDDLARGDHVRHVGGEDIDNTHSGFSPVCSMSPVYRISVEFSTPFMLL